MTKCTNVERSIAWQHLSPEAGQQSSVGMHQQSAVHWASWQGALKLQPEVLASTASPCGVLRSFSLMPLLFRHIPWASDVYQRIVAIWEQSYWIWMQRLVSTTTNMPLWWIFTSPNCLVTGSSFSYHLSVKSTNAFSGTFRLNFNPVVWSWVKNSYPWGNVTQPRRTSWAYLSSNSPRFFIRVQLSSLRQEAGSTWWQWKSS